MDRPRPPHRIKAPLTAEIRERQVNTQRPLEKVLMTDTMVLLAGSAHPKLAQAVGSQLSKIIDEPINVYESAGRFPDGEIKVQIEPNLRGRHVFIIQGAPGIQRIVRDASGEHITMSINDAVAEVEYMVDAARRASASEITVVFPYYPYGRQERKAAPHEPISAAAVATKAEALGADRIVTMDLHAEPTQGFLRGPWDNVYASHVFLPLIEDLQIPGLTVGSPDAGGGKRAEKYFEQLGAAGLAIAIKSRDPYTGETTTRGVIGDVKDKPLLIVDDIIASAGSAVEAAKLFREHGATDLYLAAPHALLYGNALDNLRIFRQVFITDSINHEGLVLPENVREVSIAGLLAEVIKRVHTGESVSRGLILPSSSRRSREDYLANPPAN